MPSVGAGVERREFLKRASILAASTPVILSVTAGTASANHSAGHQLTEACSGPDDCDFPTPCCCTSKNICTDSAICQSPPNPGACMH